MTLAAGFRLGPYEILGQIGAGGMGEVYRARDTRLGREVAIKVLPAGVSSDPDRLRRFEQEARAASALNHPNILTVHDVGTHDGAPYVVSEFLEGETLRERLSAGGFSARKAVECGVQIAQGLAAAHEKGIVHRDLKPENVFLTRDGRAKILDFGLAKLVVSEIGSVSLTEAPTASPATEPGVILGTIGYMSPEQVRGQPADQRSDIFAFGAILYELLTGQRAFRGESAVEALNAILKEEPPVVSAASPRLSPALDRVVRRCLEKSPEERFQSARDLAFALGETETPAARRRGLLLLAGIGAAAALIIGILIASDVGRLRQRLLHGAAPARIQSLAVLPLENLSRDPQQEYFADGMTEELIANVSQISALRVISRTSVMEYKGAKKPLPEIARALNVDALVEGSVLRSGDRVRITAQLIEARSDRHLWAKSYERDLRDVLGLQAEVARAIAREIQIKLTPQEQARLEGNHPIDPKAHEAYLQGRLFLELGSEESLKKAFDSFQKALQIEPNYAGAYSGLASYYAILPFYSQFSPAQVFPQARAAAQRAVELDENLAEAHASLAYIRAYYEWDWAAAEREFRRAIELRPSYADAHFSYSRFLAASGRPEEAVAEIRRARELDPMESSLKANTALLSYFGGRYDEALKELLDLRRLEPKLPIVHWGIGLVEEQKLSYAEAIASLQQATTLSPSLNFKSSLGHAYAVAGRGDEARAILGEIEERSKKAYVPSYFSALVYAGLGDADRAFERLERAYQERSTVLAYLQLDPRLANLRGDPRFSDLLRRVGSPQP
jgi:serine/threonine protein kinase/tetratricopeptide (TPR) repeat protein